MGRICVGRLCYGSSLQWAEFAMGRDVQLPFSVFSRTSGLCLHRIIVYIDTVTPASALMFKNFFEISVTNLF